jgi:hypothetical protein
MAFSVCAHVSSSIGSFFSMRRVSRPRSLYDPNMVGTFQHGLALFRIQV